MKDNNLKANGGQLNITKSWEDLSLEEQSQIMRTAVQNGIYNLNDIKTKYNEFAGGGPVTSIEDNNPPIITTGGTGYIPNNFGQEPINAIRRRLYRNITPFGYHNPISRTFNGVVMNSPDDTRIDENIKIKNSDPQASALDAIWSTYLNIPENQRREINSQYGISKTKGGYYKFNDPKMIFNLEKDLSPDGLYSIPDNKITMMNGILGNYTTGLGRDSKGDYIFYSDSKLNSDGTPDINTGWDINPYSNTVDSDTEESTEEWGQYGQDKKDVSYIIGKTLFKNMDDISMGIGNPVPIYDKIYLDDLYEMPNEHRGGNYLPEITIYGKNNNTPNKKALGGPLVEAANIYADGGNSSDRATGNNNLGFTIRNAIAIARNLGLNDRYKGSTNDTTYARNIFNMVDPTTAIPQDFSDVFNYVRIAEKANSGDRYKYKRKENNPYSDAAWAKRLGLPYDSTILIDNSDGSVRLSKQLEKEIPTDTTFLKNRIKENETNINNTYGPQRQTLRLALEYDKDALEALRETYKTGKPVILNEHSHTSRNWSGLKPENIGTTPLNLMHRFTVQYDKNKNKMNYWDKYDFDEYEDFVPGRPFLIKGSINLKK